MNSQAQGVRFAQPHCGDGVTGAGGVRLGSAKSSGWMGRRSESGVMAKGRHSGRIGESGETLGA